MRYLLAALVLALAVAAPWAAIVLAAGTPAGRLVLAGAVLATLLALAGPPLLARAHRGLCTTR